MNARQNLPLYGALLLVLAGALLAGSVPIGLALSRGLGPTLERKAEEDLTTAPRLLADRNEARADALMMHAKDLSQTRGLASAVAAGDMEGARRLLEVAGATIEGQLALLRTDGSAVAGPDVDPALVRRTESGAMPVEVTVGAGTLRTVALAPLMDETEWLGATGVVVPIDDRFAETLAGISRSYVVLVGPDGMVAGSTADDVVTEAVVRQMTASQPDGVVRDMRVGAGRYITAAAPLGDTGAAVFVRDLDVELAVLPRLRRAVGVSAGVALLIALLLGTVMVGLVTRPVRALARVAERFAGGDVSAPTPSSRVREVNQLGQTFDAMRHTLAARLAELEEMNRELEDRQARLTALQAELVQRDRLATSGRLVAELAHEIRNPVANVRNSLELIERRLTDDPEAREFANLAIDELLRMHELAERLLDLHRPRDTEEPYADVGAIAHEVAALSALGGRDDGIELRVADEPGLLAATSPEALKQVLLNLVQNAREAMLDRAGGVVLIDAERSGEHVVVKVSDNGPGIAADVLPNVFDPFFTTKGGVSGIGLGLFVAEGIVRSNGGRLVAANRDDVRGAVFTIELPAYAAVSQTGSAG